MLSQKKNNKLDQNLALQPYAYCRSSRGKKNRLIFYIVRYLLGINPLFMVN